MTSTFAQICAPMQTGPETKLESIGDTLRSAFTAPCELKKPIAKFASLANMPINTQVRVLARRNLAMARDMIAAQNDSKATDADKFSKAMSAMAQCHMLPFTDSNDDVSLPILMNPDFAAVWDLQHDTPDFARDLSTPVWEQMWQLCWKQLKDCKQSLRVCYTGGGMAHGEMCECNTLSEAAFYSQELLHNMAAKKLKSELQLNPKNSCVYEIKDQLIIVFRKVHRTTPVEREFFCIPLKALQSRMTALEAHFEQGCTVYALKRFASACRQEEFSSDALLHQFVATSVISETNLDISHIRRLKSAAAEQTMAYTRILHGLLKTEGNHWLEATSKLMTAVICNVVRVEDDPAIDMFTVVRLWVRRLLKYVVPSLVYRWCMAAYKTCVLRSSDTSRRARWTTVLSGLCNMLAIGTSMCDDPTFLTWAPESYLLMPCSK